MNYYGYKNEKTKIVFFKKEKSIDMSIENSSLRLKAVYQLDSNKLFLLSCWMDLDEDHYQLANQTEIWPTVKNLEFLQDKTTRIHVQNVSLQPLKCDRFLVNKIPLKYINPRLQEIFLSADLSDFNGDFSCTLPQGLSIHGTIKTNDIQDKINFSTQLKNNQQILLHSEGSLKDFYLLHNAQIDLNCQGKIDLNSFEFLLPGHLKGSLDLSLAAKGLIHHLDMTGYAKLQDGSYESPQEGIMLHNGQAYFSFEHNKILLKDFAISDASKEKGTITSHGHFDLDTDKGLITAIAENFQPLHYHPIYMKLTGPIKIDLSPKLEINGKLIARNVLVDYDQFKKPYQKFVILDAKNPERKKPPKLTFIKKSLIEIAIEGPADIRGNMLKSIWTGQLNLMCHKGKWKILGELLGQKGGIIFFGKKLKMRSGKIKFDEKKDPKINMEFETRIVDHNIVVTLKGRGQDVRSNISSEPTMQTEDAYAYLLFGTKKQALSNFQTAKLVLAIASSNSSDGGIFQKLPTMVDIRQKQQSNGLDEDVLYFSQPLGKAEKTSLAFGKSLANSDLSAKIERQINSHVKTDIGVVSSNVKKANFEGEFGVSFGKNY